MRSCNPLSLWHGSCLPVPRPLNQFPAGEKCWLAARWPRARRHGQGWRSPSARRSGYDGGRPRRANGRTYQIVTQQQSYALLAILSWPYGPEVICPSSSWLVMGDHAAAKRTRRSALQRALEP